MRTWVVVVVAGLALACDEGAGGEGGEGGEGGAGGGAGGAVVTPDMMIGGAGGMGGGVTPDTGPRPDARPMVDPDVGPRPDMRVGPLPDVGGAGGDGCDPRERAAACEPGQFCVHVPGSPEHIGRCQQGDGCVIGVAGSCPDAARPYCHLKGGGTFCTAAGVLEEGDDCVDDLSIPQPCADGLVCNNSVCQVPCVVGQENECPDEGRCADISMAVGVAGGLCAPRGCNWFDSTGCEAGEKCNYAIRDGRTIVGSCGPEGGNQQNAPCSFGPGGGDNCAAGLACTGAPGGDQNFCIVLCDLGAYESPCPMGQRCEERLATARGGLVRGYGICITNR